MLDTAKHAVGLDATQERSAPRPIRIVVVSDTRLYREGLAEVFARTASLRVVAAAAHAEEALAGLAVQAVGVVLLSLDRADTLDPARLVVAAHPGVRVVALAVDDRPEDVVPLAEAGVCGYVPRDAALTDLVGTLRSVVRGESPCSPGVAAGLLRRLGAPRH